MTLPAPFAPGEQVGGVVVRDESIADRLEERVRTAWTDARPVDPDDGTAGGDDENRGESGPPG